MDTTEWLVFRFLLGFFKFTLKFQICSFFVLTNRHGNMNQPNRCRMEKLFGDFACGLQVVWLTRVESKNGKIDTNKR